jgi:hypothetical protein
MFRREDLRAAAFAVLPIVLCPAALKVSGGSPVCATSEEAKLVASDPQAYDGFGWSVAISSDTVVVGAQNDDHAGFNSAGSVSVFVRSGTTWSEEAWLTASDPETGAYFGTSVALSGDTLIVGAVPDDSAAYVFVRSGTTWSEQAKLTARDVEHRKSRQGRGPRGRHRPGRSQG